MKKKLIASILAAMMVTSVVPATVFAGEEPPKEEAPAAAKDPAVANVETLIDALDAVEGAAYTKAKSDAVAAAKTAYDNLAGFNKTAVDAAKVTKLNGLVKKFAAWNKLIANAETALNRIPAQVVSDDFTTTGSVGAAEAALKAITDDTANAAELKKGLSEAAAAKNTNVVEKKTDITAALTAIDKLEPSKITRENYAKDDDAMITLYKAAKTAIDKVDDAVLGNIALYNKITDKIAAYTAEVEAVKKLAQKTEYTAEIGTEEGQVSLQKAETAYKEVKAAFDQLSAAQKTASALGDGLTARAAAITAAKDAAALQDKIAKLETLVNRFPATVTLENEALVEEAIALKTEILDVDSSALDSKTVLTAKLTEAENQINAAYAALDNEAKAKRVKELVAKIPADPNQATTANKAAVLAAAAEYNKGTNKINVADGTQSGDADPWQALVTKERDLIRACIEVIVSAETAETTALGNLKSAYEALDDDIAALDATKAEALRAAIKAAKADYDKLSRAAKEKFDTEDTYAAARTAYADAEKALKKFDNTAADTAAAKKIVDLMKAVPDTGFDKAANVEKLNAAKKAYEAASEDVQAIVKTAPNDSVFAWYEKAVKAYNTYKASTQAPAVESMIAALPMLKADGSATEADIDAALVKIKAAKNALAAIDEDNQGQVKNTANIKKAETAAKAAAVKLVDDMIAGLGNTTAALTEKQKTAITKAKALVEKYEITTTDLKGSGADYTAAVTKLQAEIDTAAAQELADLRALVDLIPAEITKDNVATVIAAQEKYEKLSEAAKALLAKADDANYASNQAAVKKLTKAYDKAVLISLDRAKITAIPAKVYTGSAVTPAVEVKDAKGNVIAASEYKTFYKNNVNVGKATVSVVPTEESKYAGTTSIEFNITAKSISAAKTSKMINYLYNGKARTQKNLRVVVGKNVLEAGKDYTVKYANNKNIGFATITITGKGNYKGTKTAKFKVVPNKLKAVTVKSPSRKLVKITVTPVTADKAQKVRYQYQFKVKGASKWTTKYSAKSTLTLGKSVKSGKTYQVRVREYKGSGKTFVPGAYSAVKTIKVK